MEETRFFQTCIKIGISLFHFGVSWNLKAGQNFVGNRSENQIGLMVIDAVHYRLFRIKIAEANIHQRGRFHNMGRRALNHGDVGTLLPQCCANIMRGIVGADDHAFLAFIFIGPGMIAGMMLIAFEFFSTRKFWNVRHAGLPSGHNQLLRFQGYRLSTAHNFHHPLLFLFIILGTFANG